MTSSISSIFAQFARNSARPPPSPTSHLNSLGSSSVNSIQATTKLCGFTPSSLIKSEPSIARWPVASFFTGPSHGYLYAASHGSLHLNCYLLNPITKDVLPFASTRYQRPFLVCMGPDPVKSDDYMAFIDDTFSQTMGFYRPRYWEWTYVQMPSLELNLYHACLKGAYYMSEDETGDTVVVDIACGFSFTVPSPKIPASSDHVYFVESAGKILRIDKQLNRSFAIYHLHVEGEIGQSRWVKTNCIGNQILFLDLRNGISITASPSTGLRGNCVYYLESPGVLKYNIEDGQTEKVPCPFKTGSTWLVPDVIDYQRK
ncbi:F-box protein [Rhynchospora pubera]|uniref:F-box protein n=1 Tax=Rhynchospora pubera TaxID=906938 RepID=A0AAV8AQI5_9POAL|nr:F-box protein SKIP23 [Rhynchospora pubera]KAJ4800690.1 F-box protein [Rhynchospora pubera]